MENFAIQSPRVLGFAAFVDSIVEYNNFTPYL